MPAGTPPVARFWDTCRIIGMRAWTPRARLWPMCSHSWEAAAAIPDRSPPIMTPDR